MPDLGQANFSIAGMGGIKRRLITRMEERHVAPQDFAEGVGLGTNDDTDAIQAVLDYAFVSGGEDYAHLCKTVRFPSGLYRITRPLIVNHCFGVNLIGTGSNQVRIFWDPDTDPHLITNVYGEDFYPLVEFRTCNQQRIEGITFDASLVQGVVLHNATVTAGHGYGDGTDGYYRDVHVTNAAASDGRIGRGVYYSGAAMGSERTWWKSKFTNCEGAAYVVIGGNTINHFFYCCEMKNNGYGVVQVGPGSSFCFVGNENENDADGNDYMIATGGVSVLGCHSKTPNFLAISGYVAGNVHDSETPGLFFTDIGGGFEAATIVGNRSTNGTVYVTGGTKGYQPDAGISPGHFFVGNQIDTPNYWQSSITALHQVGSTRVWIDGVRVNPPTPSSWNPYDIASGIHSASQVLSNGNRTVTPNVGSTVENISLCGWLEHRDIGKWYFEITVTTLPSGKWGVGISNSYRDGADTSPDTFSGKINNYGVTMPAVAGNADGNAIYNNGLAYTFDTDPTIAAGSVIGVAFDAVAMKVWFRHNGTWLKGDPVAGTNGCPATVASGTAMFPYAFFRPLVASDGSLTINVVGSFAHTIPSGFAAWG